MRVGKLVSRPGRVVKDRKSRRDLQEPGRDRPGGAWLRGGSRAEDVVRVSDGSSACGVDGRVSGSGPRQQAQGRPRYSDPPPKEAHDLLLARCRARSIAYTCFVQSNLVRALERAGFTSPAVSPARYVELLHIACRVRDLGLRAIGLVPASLEAHVPALGIQVAVVMADICDGTVAYVDANPRHPAFSALLPSGIDGCCGFAELALADRLVLVTLLRVPADARDLTAVEAEILHRRDEYTCMLVDLTGYEELGELPRALAWMQGVLVVAQAGETTQADLLACHRVIPKSLALGVILAPERRGKAARLGQ